MKTYPNRNTDHITIGRDPELTYMVLKAIIDRRNRVSLWQRMKKRITRRSNNEPFVSL